VQAGAENVLQRMEARGLEPDVITYNSLLKVYSNARDVDGCGRGLDLVRQMVDRRLKPTHVTFKTLFSLLLKFPDSMKLQAALMLLNEHLPVRSRNSPIYAPLIELCGVLGHLDAAMHYFEEARRGGHVDKFVLRAARSASRPSRCCGVCTAL
jgi:pentatricopeptide repeat protein